MVGHTSRHARAVDADPVGGAAARSRDQLLFGGQRRERAEMIWLYADTKEVKKVADLSTNIFWLVLPSLALFVVLPLLLKKWTFVPSLVTGTLIMFVCYGAMIFVLRRFGMSF